VRAYLLQRHGGIGGLTLTNVPEPLPGRGQVLIRTEAVGLNYAEILSRKGLYGWAPKLPYVPGMEAVGRVEAVGEGVAPSRVGDRVVVGTQHGAYADALVVPEVRAVPWVESWTVEENAAFGVNWMTAWVGLMEMGRLRPSDRVLVSPAGGGVGTAAVQIASRFGCEVLAMAGSEYKLARVKELGAHVTINYRRPGWQEELSAEAKRRGIDVALEMVGGGVFRQVIEGLAPLGRVVVAGYAGLDYSLWNPLSLWRAWRGVPRMSLDHMLKRSNGILSTHLGYLLRDPALMGRLRAELLDFALGHGIRPIVGHVLPFEEMAEAHRLMESRESYGKIVLTV